ncbi:hypothetical protein Hanom_Chr05g00394441 [Helianthus anomalus]
MIDRILPRHGAVLRATQFYPAVTPASLSCGGSIVRRPGPNRTSRPRVRG